MEFAKKHWKPSAALALALCLTTGAFVAGRHSVTPVEDVVIQAVEVEKIVYKDRIVEKTVFIEAKKEHVKKTRTVVTKPDGTKTDTTVVDHKTDTDTNVKTDKVEERIVYQDRRVEVQVEVKAAEKDWRVSALAGANLSLYPGLISGDAFDPLKHLTYGVHVERRIVGPFTVGVWGLTTGQVGLSAGLEF